MIQELSIYINGKWETLDPPTEAVAMNFQVNTLAEMKDRNASYSQAISLPRSMRNERLLGVQLRVDVDSRVPYRSYPCELLEDGSRVSPAGAVIRITSLKKGSIGAQILGANADLIETLKAKSTETVKADGFGMIWMNSRIKPSGTLSNGVRYQWGYANIVKNLLSKDDAGAPEGYINSPDKVYPALDFGDVVEWILKQEGYTLDLKDDPQLGRPGTESIPAIVPKCAQWDTAPTSFDAYCTGSAGIAEVTWEVTRIPIPGMWGVCNYTEWGYMLYYATWDGDITLRVICSTLTATQAALTIRKNGVIATQKYIKTTGTEDFTISLKAGDQLKINFDKTALAGAFTATVSVRTTLPKETTGIAIGAQYDLLASLGFNNRADILQEFLRLYGLTMEVDSANKIVHMYTLGYLINRESEAVDWSDKLIPGQGELTYTVGNYAQKNTFGKKTDETNGISDEYTFTVDDTNLDPAKTLWTSKFLAITNVANGSEDAAPNFPIYEVDRSTAERTGWTLKYSKQSNPVLISPTTGRNTLELTQGYNSDIWQVDTVTVSRLYLATSDYLADYFAPLWTNVLDKAKAIQVTLNLNAVDIETLDLSKPVWLEQYGHYFYISKIVNYISGKLTKINLIRL